MTDRLAATLNFATQALALRSERQKIIAANIANADTPGYQARDIDFSSTLKQRLMATQSSNHEVSLALTSARHIAGHALPLPSNTLLYRIPDQPSADGNTVDMDRERVQFADNSLKYQSDLTYISNQIKWMNSVLQG